MPKDDIEIVIEQDNLSNDLVEHIKLHFLDFLNNNENIEDDNTEKSSYSIWKIF